MTSPRMPHDDLAAALAARQELGPEYDDAFVEKLVERVEQTIELRLNARQELDRQEAEAERRAGRTLAYVSLGMSVPLSAIALGEDANGLALLIVWTGLVMINVAHALRGRRR